MLLLPQGWLLWHHFIRDDFGGGWDGDLTQFGDTVGGGGCIGVVVAGGEGMNVDGGGAANRGNSAMSGGGVLVQGAKLLVKGIVTDSLELFKRSGKISHAVLHFF